MYWNVLHLNTERLIRILTLLTEPDTVPVPIHCAAGRDRTGAIVAFSQATRPETMHALFARIRAEYAYTAGLLDGLGVPVSLIASLNQSLTTAEETAHSSAGLTAGYSSTTAVPPGRQPISQSTSSSARSSRNTPRI
jgi:hypothetical protein